MATIAKARSHGWKVFVGDAIDNSAGQATGGLITMSRWPMKKASSQVDASASHRCLTVANRGSKADPYQ